MLHNGGVRENSGYIPFGVCSNRILNKSYVAGNAQPDGRKISSRRYVSVWSSGCLRRYRMLFGTLAHRNGIRRRLGIFKSRRLGSGVGFNNRRAFSKGRTFNGNNFPGYDAHGTIAVIKKKKRKQIKIYRGTMNFGSAVLF